MSSKKETPVATTPSSEYKDKKEVERIINMDGKISGTKRG